MTKRNKAQAATANRIARLYDTTYNDGDGVDIQADSVKIVVETGATIQAGLQRLAGLPGWLYLAVTNREALPDAMRATEGTPIGVMDSRGNIVKPASAE